MTHTLNRRGLSEDRSGEEAVVLFMVHRAEMAEKAPRLLPILETVLKYKPVNIIGAPAGLDEEQIKKWIPRGGIITAVFTDIEDVAKIIAEVKAMKAGISLVVSALFSDVRRLCRATGLKEHTYNVSLGIFGRTERLPGEKTLEIVTQCGHGLVSPHLVRHVVRKIRQGRMTPEEGAKQLVKPCVCGIVNPQRTARLLKEMAALSGPTP